MVQEAAQEVHDLFDQLGVVALPKTTGNRGIHVFAGLQPRWTSVDVRAAAVAVARELERRRPDLITAAWWKEERGTRVFVDFNQNAPHKTIFGAWSVRARPGAQVSTPFAWDELWAVSPDELTIANVPERARLRGDPWAAWRRSHSRWPRCWPWPSGTGRLVGRCSLAAGVPEDAGRAASGGPQPGEEACPMSTPGPSLGCRSCACRLFSGRGRLAVPVRRPVRPRPSRSPTVPSPVSGRGRGQPWSLWRYRKALPFSSSATAWQAVTMGEGATPLVAIEGGLRLKLDFLMPTLSFKDRGAVVLVAKAAEMGARRLVADSSGNAGASIAAYAARAGIDVEVFVPERHIGQKSGAVDGLRGGRAPRGRFACRRRRRRHRPRRTTGAFYASHVYNPLFHHGTKTFAFELWEQLGGRLPAPSWCPPATAPC